MWKTIVSLGSALLNMSPSVFKGSNEDTVKALQAKREKLARDIDSLNERIAKAQAKGV